MVGRLLRVQSRIHEMYATVPSGLSKELTCAPQFGDCAPLISVRTSARRMNQIEQSIDIFFRLGSID